MVNVVLFEACCVVLLVVLVAQQVLQSVAWAAGGNVEGRHVDGSARHIASGQPDPKIISSVKAGRLELALRQK
jgi:hypothetical protein